MRFLRTRVIALCSGMFASAIAGSSLDAASLDMSKAAFNAPNTTTTPANASKAQTVVRDLTAEEQHALEDVLGDYLNKQITDPDAVVALGLAFGDDMRRHGDLA